MIGLGSDKKLKSHTLNPEIVLFKKLDFQNFAGPLTKDEKDNFDEPVARLAGKQTDLALVELHPPPANHCLGQK